MPRRPRGHGSCCRALAIDGSGRSVVAGYASTNTGYRFGVARLTSAGTLDGSFSSDGVLMLSVDQSTESTAYAVAVDASNRIVAAGRAKVGGIDQIAVVRLTAAGALDPTFSANGMLTTLFPGSTKCWAAGVPGCSSSYCWCRC